MRTAKLNPSATPLDSKPAAKRRRTRAEWQALLSEYDSSGLSQAAFCKNHRIATASLHNWRKKLAAQDGSTDFIDITTQLSTTQTLVPSEPESTAPWQVELELGRGLVLRLRGI